MYGRLSVLGPRSTEAPSNFECAVLNVYCIEHTLPHARTGCAELLGRHAAVGGVSATSTCTCSDGRVLLYGV